MTHCSACGEELKAGAPFCNACGEPATPAAAAIPVAPAPRPPVPDLPRPAPIVPSSPQPAEIVPINRPEPPRTAEYREELPDRPRASNVNALLAIGLIAIALIVWFGYEATKSKPAGGPVTSASSLPGAIEPKPSPPLVPEELVPEPAITEFAAATPRLREGKWTATLQWNTKNATSAFLAIDDQRYKVDAGFGSRTVELTGALQTATLIAFGTDGKEAISKVTIAAAPSEQEPEIPPSTGGNDAPAVPNFEVAGRSDTPIGTVFRIANEPNIGGQISCSVNGNEFKYAAARGHLDFFVSRRVTLTLKAGDTTEEITLEPNFSIATAPERRESGPALHDFIDIVSYLAGSVEFSECATRAATSPVDGYLANLFASTTKYGFDVHRNAICARHGFVFKRKDLKDMFEARPWYSGDTADADVLASRFSPLVKRNLQWLRNRQDAAK